MPYRNTKDKSAANRRSDKRVKARIGEVAYRARQLAAMKRWRDSHPGYTRGKKNTYKAVVQAYLRGLKSEPCTDCGVSYPYYVMQFDHIRGDKAFGLASGVKVSMRKLQSELAKCELVCANCHAERTHQRGAKMEFESRQAKLDF